MDRELAQHMLRQLFDLAVSRAQPEASWFTGRMPAPAIGRNVVIAAGKAAVGMTVAFAEAWASVYEESTEYALEGLAVSPHGSLRPTSNWPENVDLRFAAHPVPDVASAVAGQVALSLAASLGPDDALFALLSGGGSSLLVAPREGISLAQKIEVNAMLLRSGAPIATINAVRQRLSRIKGGGLAQAAGAARIHTFCLSDVPGDDLAMIASGPTINSDSEPLDRQISEALGLPEWTQPFVSRAAHRGQTSGRCAPPVCVASASQSLADVEALAQSWGWEVENLGDSIEGDAARVAQQHAALLARRGFSHAIDNAPVLLLSGGETSVQLGDGPSGSGGRNSTYLVALGLACATQGVEIIALAGDTDGIDGKGAAAGGWLSTDDIRDALHVADSPARAIADADTGGWLARRGLAITTGPTGTNVNDLRAVLLLPGSPEQPTGAIARRVSD